MKSYAGAADQYGYVLAYTDGAIYKTGAVPLEMLTPENVREYEARVRSEAGPVITTEVVEADRLVILSPEEVEQYYFGSAENMKKYRIAGKVSSLDFSGMYPFMIALVRRGAVETEPEADAAAF